MIKLYTFLLTIFCILGAEAQLTMDLNQLNDKYLSLNNFGNSTFTLDIPEPGIGTIEFVINNAKGEAIIRGEIRDKFFMVGLNTLDFGLFNNWMPGGPEGILLKNGGKIPTGDFVTIMNISLNSDPSKKMSALRTISLPKIEPIQLIEPQEDKVFKDNKLQFVWGMPQVETENKIFKLKILEAKGKKIVQPDINDHNFVFEAQTASTMYNFLDAKEKFDYDKHYMWYVAMEIDGITYATSPVRYFYFDIVDETSPKYIEKNIAKPVKSK